MFTQRISMDCTKWQYEKCLKDELLKMGYNDIDVTFWKEETVIVNNTGGEIGGLGTLIDARKEKHDRIYLGIFNAPLFLALAAMTDKAEGNYGEYIISLHSGMLFKMEQDDKIRPELDNLRKATKEEIMAKFMGIKSKVGDYITIVTPNTGVLIGILSKDVIRRGDNGVIEVLAGLVPAGRLITSSFFGFQVNDIIRPSTEEEKGILDQKLKSVGMYFDVEKLELCTQPKTEIKMAEFKVKRSELQKVYEVACSDWKDRIIRMLEKYGDPFSASVTLPEEEVRQMFEAATSDQTKILRKVFPVWEDQGPVRNLSEGEEKRVDELLQELSTLLFGVPDELQLTRGWAARQPELKGKTIGVLSFGVRLHESKVVSGVTLIEFTRK